MSKSSDKKTTFGLDEAQISRLLQLGSDPAPEPLTDNQVGSEKSSSTSKDESLLNSAGSPQIEGYDILAKLGEAGQGQVWRALQLSTGREVALKVPRIGSLISDRTRMRFEREVELAARLKHPRIARLLDSGIIQGQYYYVMDLIEGTNLNQYVQNKDLSQKAILKLMYEICQAVQHAHQKGIIHRDLKPSNIIVTEDGVPYLVDFGLAKEILQEDQAPDVSLDGETLGTPAYMSPEQAAGHAEQVDTRTDVYSLGVILFHLLTGQLPHDLSGSRYDVLKRIAEGETKRLRQINTRMDKDLEILLLKALDREPDRRYASAGGLAQDIENYLTGAPLLAGSPTTLYRLKKFVRRNAVLSAAVLVVATTLFLGLAATTAMYLRSERTLGEAEAIAAFLRTGVLGTVGDAKAGEATVSFVLDAASKNLEGKFKDKPLTEASIRETLGETYRMLAESTKAEKHWLRALQIYRQHYGQDHPATLRAMNGLYWVYDDQERHHDAERLRGEMLEIGPDIDKEIYAGNMGALAHTYHHLGKYKEAESLYDKIITIIRGEHGEDYYRFYPGVACNLARVYADQGRYEEAEGLFRKTLETVEWDAEHRFRLMYTADLANIYIDQGRYEEAESLLVKILETERRVLGARHVFTLRAMCGLARVLTVQKRYEDAERLLQEGLATGRNRLRKGHPATLRFVNALAVLCMKHKNDVEAEKLLNEALRGRQQELGNDHPETLESNNDLALLYKEQAHYEKAEPLLIEALEGRRLKLGDTHPHTVESLMNLTDLYEVWGKPEKAEEWRAKLQQTEAVD